MVEQARGLGYVHLERVGTGTFTSAFGTGAVSSSFLRTRDTPARVDCDWRVGPGVRTLRALFSLPVSFFFSVLQCYVYWLLSVRLVVCFSPLTTVLFLSRRFGSLQL